MKRNGIAGILATVLLSAWSLPAGAEETYKLDPVLVTAEKRTENVQEVPVSVTAISEPVSYTHLTLPTIRLV